LKRGDRQERIDLEGGEEAAIIVPAVGLDTEAEAGQQPAQDFPDHRQPVPL
jgi:hypothetical protein